MIKKIMLASALIAVVGTIGWFLFSKPDQVLPTSPAFNTEAVIYKTLTCGCCENYANDMRKLGFKVKEVNLEDLTSVKEKHLIPREMQTCHTVIVGGYFIEGHVPFEAVKKLLEEKPRIDGIILPGMPEGSPGMPGLKKEQFTVYSITNGTTAEFMVV